jgi:hypothetical protein
MWLIALRHSSAPMAENILLPSKAEALNAAHRLRLQRRAFTEGSNGARNIAKRITRENMRKKDRD